MASEARPSFAVLYAADSAVMDQDERFKASGKRRSPADITRAAVRGAEPLIRQQVLEELLGDEAVEAVARVMFKRGGLPAVDGTQFEELPSGQQEGFRTGARIYLQAAIASVKGGAK